MNCTESENEFDDVDTDSIGRVETTTVSVKVGGKEVLEIVTKKPVN